MRVKGNVRLELAKLAAKFSPSGGLFEPSLGDRDQSINQGMQSEQLGCRSLRSPSDLAIRERPLQLTGQRQRQNRIANMAESRNQKAWPIPIHDFQSFENPINSRFFERSKGTALQFRNPPTQ